MCIGGDEKNRIDMPIFLTAICEKPNSPDASQETAYADFLCAVEHKCARLGGKYAAE